MIAAHYEEDPESFHEEIRQLDQLREVSWYAPCWDVAQIWAPRDRGAGGGGTGPLVTLYCQQKPYVLLLLCYHFLCCTWSSACSLPFDLPETTMAAVCCVGTLLSSTFCEPGSPRRQSDSYQLTLLGERDPLMRYKHQISQFIPSPLPSGKMCTRMLSISRKDCRSSKPQSCTTSVSAAQMNMLYYFSVDWCRLPSLNPSLPW